MRSTLQFSLQDMTACLAQIRSLGETSPSMEATARSIVAKLYERFDDGVEPHPCALLRCFKLMQYQHLPTPLQTLVQASIAEPPATLISMTLLATTGQESAWCDRRQSQGHRAIPLPGPDAVAQLPMIMQLITQLGYEAAEVVTPDSRIFTEDTDNDYNVFHVEDAVGSAYIPAQETFVKPYGIRSVVGFGGALPDQTLFAVIGFFRTHVARATAELFAPLAIGVKLSLLPFIESGRIFDNV